MTEFGIEESFAKAAARMKEHHGVEISPTTVGRFTETHAERAQKALIRETGRSKHQKQIIVGWMEKWCH